MNLCAKWSQNNAMRIKNPFSPKTGSKGPNILSMNFLEAHYDSILANPGALDRRGSPRRMIDQAAQLHADAIINVRYMTTSVIGSAAELLAYGTAVKLSE